MNRRKNRLNNGTALKGWVILIILFLPWGAARAQDTPAHDSVESISKLLAEYVKYPSITGNENVAGEYLVNLCRERGLDIRIFSESKDSYNFAASLYPLESAKPNIIFLNHMDVVKVGDPEGWKYPPFSGAIVEDTVWGRGTIDMKGVAVMQLTAITHFIAMARSADLPYNVTFLSVSGEEEYGSKGAGIISETYFDELHAEVIIGEGGAGLPADPSGDQDQNLFLISTCDKRALWLNLRVEYPHSGHGSVTPLDYANKIMVEALGNVTAHKEKVQFSPLTRSMLKSYSQVETGIKRFVLKRPVLFKPLIVSSLRKDPLLLSTVSNTITLTKFYGQDNDLNQIPQEIIVGMDCRLLPETSTEEFIQSLEKITGTEEIEISVIKETVHAPPTEPDRYFSHIETSLNEVYGSSGAIPILFPATTDNNYFRSKGIPVYGFIPFILDEDLLKTIHNYNERIPVSALEMGAEVYTHFLEKILLAGQEIP